MSTTLEVPSRITWWSPMTWRKDQILGKGASGVVYLATYCTINGDLHHIAIKTSVMEYAFMLEKESRILMAFRGCPEIIQCYTSQSSIELGSEYYNVLLEYSPYGNLRDVAAQFGDYGLPENYVRSYTRMILKGLQCIHERGYVHCDIKPDNILVFPSQHSAQESCVKIADFGITKEPVTDIWPDYWEESLRGTIDYMSPEYVVLGEIGPERDIWSLGCVVLEMMTGRRTWFGWVEMSTDELFYWIGYPGVSPTIPEHISEAGKDFLRRCFERDPKMRWSAVMLLNHPYVTHANT